MAVLIGRAPRGLALLAVSLLVIASCGDEGAGDTTTSEVVTSTAVTTTAPADAPTTTERPSVSTTSLPSTSTTAAPGTTTTTIDGRPTTFGPQDGDVLGVAGVTHEDSLNLRSAPSTTQPILDKIPPLQEGLIATGENWEASNALWARVDFEGTVGWVHTRYVAYIGSTDDLTSWAVEKLGGYPTAATMEALGEMIAPVFSSEDPPSVLVMTASPTAGDLGEVTFDVIGLGDDSVGGLRLHIFGEPGAEGFTLKAVEVTELCTRGTDDSGFCV